MPLRCGGIFNNHFITRLLLSQLVKSYENLSTFLAKLCGRVWRLVFFLLTGYNV